MRPIFADMIDIGAHFEHGLQKNSARPKRFDQRQAITIFVFGGNVQVGSYERAQITAKRNVVRRTIIESPNANVQEMFGGRVGPEVRFEDVADGQLAEEVARELRLIR